MMAKRTKPHPLLLPLLNAIFSLCILVLSAHTYRIYKNQHTTNPWWLPVWLAHFDTSGLISSIVCSVILLVISLFSIGVAIRARKTKMLATLSLGLAVLGFAAALVALVVPAVANARDPARSDTPQTWTCRWKSVSGAPEDFAEFCGMTRFTTYAPIPILVSQVLLLGKAVREILDMRQKKFGDDGEEELVGITKSVEGFGGKHGGGSRVDVESRGSSP